MEFENQYMHEISSKEIDRLIRTFKKYDYQTDNSLRTTSKNS